MTLSINGKTYEASELIAYVEKLEKENLYNKDIIETNTAEWEEQGQRIVVLEKENAELKGLKDVATLIRANNDIVTTLMQLNNKLVSKSQQLTKAKAIINIGVEGLKHWGIVAGYERPFAKEAEKLFNLFLDKAEQFLNSEGVK